MLVLNSMERWEIKLSNFKLEGKQLPKPFIFCLTIFFDTFYFDMILTKTNL